MTKIPWCDETWNPVTGCTPTSEGCKNCYAMAMFKRKLWDYDDTIQLHEERLWDVACSGEWKDGQRVFVGSMTDLWHDDVDWDWLDKIFAIMGCCEEPDLRGITFMVLTKRPERMKDYLWYRGKTAMVWPPNVWAGATTENQIRFSERFYFLQQMRTAVRFVSCEPLLGLIDMRPLRCINADRPYLDWVIVGAETGPGKRKMELDWARSIRDQCFDADVPFFFKRGSDGETTLDGKEWHQFPLDKRGRK